MQEKRKKLTDILVEERVITMQQLDETLKEQRTRDIPIQELLISKGLITSEQLGEAMARQFDIPYVELSKERIDPQVIKMLSEDIARQYNAIPVKLEGNDLYVAFSSPLNMPARDEIKLLTGCTIKPMIATEKEIQHAISKHYKPEEPTKQALIDMRLEKLKVTGKERVAVEEEIKQIQDLPVVRLVNDIINGAINAKASDIHLEAQDPEMIVRCRVDGILHDIMTIPKHIEPAVVSRIKILANLDITERRRSQDGHISLTKDGKEYDFRVSTLLTINGEKVVLRILDKSAMLISLENLGFSKYDEAIFRTLIDKPYGMILVTGPTGSGKTTTLYAVLSQLNSEASNIITIEDPVEYKLDRINQIQVDPGAKMTFATGLRTILRQDPDIIMVGEIRDFETAEMAIHAALTGHLVLSTLHTNDAPSAITRLIDMGVEPFLISSTVVGALAQRLCRTVCPECKSEYEPSVEELEFLRNLGSEIETGTLVKGKGCDYCFQTGFKGRQAVFEVMKVSDKIRELVVERSPAIKIKEIAVKEGMNTLQQNGIQKVLDGISTLGEVKRVVYVE